jgi:anthranilate synthase component 2
MILLIDNYDSFSYNLYQLIGSLDPAANIRVARNDAISIAAIQDLGPDQIILSPGPGRPRDAGICEEAVRAFGGRIPLLGVCLGCQAIGEVFGALIGYAQKLMHGRSSAITLDPVCPLFAGLPRVIQAGRYHSLAIASSQIPETLMVSARSDDGEIMGIRHREHPIYGLQFHPESILTPAGKTIMANFLKIRSPRR